MRVGFLNNQIDNRGTGNAIFDYALYNELILGNESFIYTLDHQPRHPAMERKLTDTFGYIWGPANYWPKIDVMYHIKSGYDDHFRGLQGAKYVVHSVFDNQPHGDVYAFISDWMADVHGGISVPHIVSVDQSERTLREELGLQPDNIVFGRYGGADSFDLSFVWDAINETTLIDDNINFIFMNTNKPSMKLMMEGKQIFFLEDTANPRRKREFINTCNAMIHARSRGETFGISVGEFDIVGKPVLTYANSPEQAHFDNMTPKGLKLYENRHDLLMKFLDHSWLYSTATLRSKYKTYNPINVMKRFNEVFLESSVTV